MMRDIKELIGILMRVLDSAEVTEAEVLDLAFEADGELLKALNEAYIKIEGFDLCAAWQFFRRGLLIGLLASLGLATFPGARADDGAGAFVEQPNVKLWITDTGGSGDPVILLHANTGTSESWQNRRPCWPRPAIGSLRWTGPVGAGALSVKG